MIHGHISPECIYLSEVVDAFTCSIVTFEPGRVLACNEHYDLPVRDKTDFYMERPGGDLFQDDIKALFWSFARIMLYMSRDEMA